MLKDRLVNYRTTRYLIILVVFFIIMPILGGRYSISLGKDFNWDLRNYHYYNAYAFYENRLGYDITPASLQTFISPILDLPFYWMVRNLSAARTVFALGAVQMFNLSLLFLIYYNFARRALDPLWIILGGIVLCVVSAFAPGFRDVFGTTYNDSLVSIFGLAAFLLLVLASDQLDNSRAATRLLIFLSGLLLGAGTGLKLTLVIHAVGGAICLLYLFRRRMKELVAAGLLFGFGGLLGFVVTYGYWGWLLYQKFESPFFPFYNSIFKSPYTTPSGFTDAGGVGPSSLLEYILSPIFISLKPARFAGHSFEDYRFPILLAFLVAYAGLLLFRRLRPMDATPAIVAPSRLFNLTHGNLLLIFVSVSYLVWLLTLGYYRSMIGVELLVPLTGLVLLDRLIASKRWVAGVACAAGLLLLVTFTPMETGRAELTEPFFGVKVPPRLREENSLVVMLSNDHPGFIPYAYVIPSFPSDARFVRKPTTFAFGDDGLLYQQMIQVIEEHRGPRYVIFFEIPALNRDERVAYVMKEMKFLPFEVTVGMCKALEMNVPDRLILCQISIQQPPSLFTQQVPTNPIQR